MASWSRFLIPPGIIAMFLGLLVQTATAADHAESPSLVIANAPITGGRDINDVYIFQSPVNANNTVMIVTTNPFAGAVSPTTFDTRVQYEFLIDNNGDAREDITFRFQFGAPDINGVQTYTLSTFSNKVSPVTQIRGSANTGQNANFPQTAKIRAAIQDDPFFFDSRAFTDLVTDGVPGNGGTAGFPRNPAHNFFGPANKVLGGNPAPNVLAIAIELPSTLLQNGANQNIGLWCVTKFNGRQADRMGRPAIATALIPRVPRNNPAQRQDMRDRFNETPPSRDAIFRPDMIAILTNFYGNGANAQALANILLPDILTFNTGNAGGFLNGRRLEDDVLDAELGILTNGGITTDNVPNDSVFLNVFPYIGNPNATPQAPNPN